MTSYIVPDSDDEAIVDDDGENAMMALLSMQAKKRKVESNLQRWIKHLSALLVDEQRKVRIYHYWYFSRRSDCGHVVQRETETTGQEYGW